MHETNNVHDKPYRKSARPVGDVMGQYHPHGDSAIYDALVRMAQDFSMSLPLLDGQGNFGSMDGGGGTTPRPCATPKCGWPHRRSTCWPISTRTRSISRTITTASSRNRRSCPPDSPTLLVNGAGGIAVGMATNIPPHNLGEVIDACQALIENPDLSSEQLIDYVPAPDFPTGALILGRSGARKAYLEGRGSVIIRAKTRVEEIRKDRYAIVIDEIPLSGEQGLDDRADRGPRAREEARGASRASRMKATASACAW